MFIQFDRDNCRNLLIQIGDRWQFAIHWYRVCPMGVHCSSYDPYADICPVCKDKAVIPWYRGWIFELRRWWAYGPGYRIWEWREKRRERRQ